MEKLISVKMTRKSEQLNCKNKINSDFCTVQRDTNGKNISHLTQGSDHFKLIGPISGSDFTKKPYDFT